MIPLCLIGAVGFLWASLGSTTLTYDFNSDVDGIPVGIPFDLEIVPGVPQQVRDVWTACSTHTPACVPTAAAACLSRCSRWRRCAASCRAWAGRRGFDARVAARA